MWDTTTKLLWTKELTALETESLLTKYADVSDAAKRLSIHPESVRRLIRQKKLPGIKFGNKWLIERGVLEQFANYYDPRPGNKTKLL